MFRSKMVSVFVLGILLIFFSVSQAQFKLTMQFAQMSPHVGQMLYIRVLDNGPGLEVGRSVMEITSPDFSVDLYVIVPNHSYRIDFFADLNMNGQYDSPGTDHAWRLDLVNAQGDTTLNFTHNLNFTDINWPQSLDITQFAGTWEGIWENLTFGSTGNITAQVTIDTDNQIVRLQATTSGIFGNPDTVSFMFEATLPTNNDTLVVHLTSPDNPSWGGRITLINGHVYGSIMDSSFNATINIDGTFGPAQTIFVYDIPLFAANGVVLMTNITQTTSIKRRNLPVLPGQIMLFQNFPNPFNPQTTIPFNLNKAGKVKLIVYDLLGREVAHLVDRQLLAGYYEVQFNASRLPSGVYLYKLQMGEFQNIKKMLLVR